VCNDLLIGSIYDVDNAIPSREIEKKLEIMRTRGIPPAYWRNALVVLDEGLVAEMKEEDLDWDEFVGTVMIWKLAKDKEIE
jgi:hypothetical protein